MPASSHQSQIWASTCMDLTSLLTSRFIYLELRAFLYADEELHCALVSAEVATALASDRRDILAGLSLWIRLRMQREYDEELSAQLSAKSHILGKARFAERHGR